MKHCLHTHIGCAFFGNYIGFASICYLYFSVVFPGSLACIMHITPKSNLERAIVLAPCHEELKKLKGKYNCLLPHVLLFLFFYSHLRCVVLVTLRDIKQGEELFSNYYTVVS